MSLKFAALSSLTLLSAFGTPARADDQAQKSGPGNPREPNSATVSKALITPAKAAAAEPQAEGTERA
jgi:hypothetical protein